MTAQAYTVKRYRDIKKFEEGLNEMAGFGYLLDSWQIDRGYEVTAVFVPAVKGVIR